MRLVLEKRAEHSTLMAVLSPVLAIGLTVFVGAIVFAALGLDPLAALYVYFVEPVTSLWSLEELIVKAAPLVLIGVGLAVCYLANVWNIGAEGQLTAGALVGSIVPVMFHDWQSPLVLPSMLLLGAAGGMAYAAIPAVLKNRFGANEILTSLMLVYVAQLALDWLVRGPWRDPGGFNFPKSVTFEDWQLLPTLGAGRVHLGALIALLVVVVLAVVMARTLKGFEIRVLGNAPRAGRFAGFSRDRMVVYGFTAIIVAFLGRLNPVGVLFAGLLLAISYLGGEAAQVSLGISDKIAKVFQGILLFFVLACDTLILYRITVIGGRLLRPVPAE